MLGSDNGNLTALAEVSKYTLMAQEWFAPVKLITEGQRVADMLPHIGAQALNQLAGAQMGTRCHRRR